MERDIVYLVWNNPKNKKKYKVGMLYKENNTYYFKYLLDELKIALKDGFKLLMQFPNINATYENKNLFPSFGARLPAPTRPEIKEILSHYDMEEYDEFELLKRSGARLVTDFYEFIK